LPEKKDLKNLINKKLDDDDDGEFTFAEIKSIISEIPAS
jgi:hypothetical protein